MSGLKLNIESWQAPPVKEDIIFGDMPGDKVRIGTEHITKANVIFPELLKQLSAICRHENRERAVITVCGGSGVGKSEIASLLSYYFRSMGIGSYTLSGDNYPHRMPFYNDAERLRIFRLGGIRALVADKEYSSDKIAVIRDLQRREDDANHTHSIQYPWYHTYLEGGIARLKTYLGTDQEIDFAELETIVGSFKSGENQILLKRMGRAEDELWYDLVDFSRIRILIIEWTHGNSDHYQGVDIPILLNSTPQETLAHRRERNRDGRTDSAFTMTVLKLEQEMLNQQARKAKIIVSKQGELLTYDTYTASMALEKESSDES